MIELYNMDNMLFDTNKKVNLVYADMIYENRDLRWIEKYWQLLSKDSIFIVQTDYHTSAQVKLLLDSLSKISKGEFIDEVIYKQEWGGVPKKGFPIKHDNIYIYSNGKNWKWYGDRIQIPKATAGTKLDKKGTGLKTPCSVFDDLGNFSTLDKERVKDESGHNIRWQKPLKLINRLFLPFTDEGDLILDPFMGSGTSAKWCKNNNRDFIGIESNKEIYEIARNTL